MSITPSHISIGSLFERQYIFHVPKYQRSYAWEDPQITDFICDIKKCYKARVEGEHLHHFFGGIVSILERIPGSGRQQQELIDGQQRISTFVLFVVNIINIYKKLSSDPQVSSDPTLRDLIDSRIVRLNEKYLIYNDEINRRPVKIDRLTMSKTDHNYFKELIDNTSPLRTRESHNRIYNSFIKLDKALNEIIDESTLIPDKVDSLKIFEDIINEDCTVIHIETTTKDEAYRLFQVLNDRGISLTNGDLLRSRTLELLDDNDFKMQQDYVESCWDYILKDSPKTTEDFLKHCYSSFAGKRPGSSTLYDDFLDQFFPQHKSSNIISEEEVINIKTTICLIKSEYEKYCKIKEGVWPYLLMQPISQWDCERLRILLVELDHTLCIPILLAACNLDHRKFSNIVQTIERFIFRYKYICKNHVGSLGNIYMKEAIKIRQNPTDYNVESLKRELRILLNNNAQDDKFKLLLKDLEYRNRASNKILKYFLITTEYYLRWYRDGAVGVSICLDKSRIFDFANTTIEHIYPQRASDEVYNSDLQGLINDLGNLTILDPFTNNTLGNISYELKKVYFRTSSVLMNREINDKYDNWDEASIATRKEELLSIACRVFNI